MKWKYQKAEGHHHVILDNGEVLDVDTESHARLIALVPEMISSLLQINKNPLSPNYIRKIASQIKRHQS